MKHLKTPQELNESSENLNISDVMNSVLNDYQDKLKDITTKIDSLEKIYHNLSHLKVKEYNILKGKRTQLIDSIEVIQKYSTCIARCIH